MKLLLRSASALALATAALSAHAVLFDFESVAAGTAVPFSYTVSGLTASFTGGSGFRVNATSPSTPGFSGRTLADNAGGYTGGLSVAFDSPLSAFSTAFGTSAPTTLTLTAFLGNVQVGTATAPSTMSAGFSSPGGTVGFSGTLFDRVAFSTPQLQMSFDNLNVTPAPTPEPSALAALGLGAFAFVNRRRRA